MSMGNDFSKIHMSEITDLGSIENQNVMRICVNRVSLIQSIQVQHILDHLIANNVLTSSEKDEIISCSSSQDSARLLLDTLLKKDKETHWYKHFRQAMMQSQCNMDQKKKYEMLVNFLDNTIINPNKIPPAPRPIEYTEKEITNGEPNKLSYNEAEGDCTLDKADISDAEKLQQSKRSLRQRLSAIRSVHLEPYEGFESVLADTYKQHRAALKRADSNVTRRLLHLEKRVYHKMVRFELAYASKCKGLLGDQFLLCFCHPFKRILRDTNCRHLYLKYIRVLESVYLQPIVRELVVSYRLFVTEAGSAECTYARSKIVTTGLLLYDLLRDYGQYVYSEEVINVLQMFLSTFNSLQTLVPSFHAAIRLMEGRTLNLEFAEADQAYAQADALSRQLDMMSWGGHAKIDKSQFMTQVSQLSLARGYTESAYDWARAALKHCNVRNPYFLVKVLQQNVLTYANRWSQKRAEKFAIFLVQYSWRHFKEFSPQYLQSLLTFVEMSNCFHKDDFGVLVAKRAVSFAELLLGCDAPLLAWAYLLLSQALIHSPSANPDEMMFYSAQASKTALACFSDTHPVMAKFRLTEGEALICHCERSPQSSMSDVYLNCAEAQCQHALAILSTRYGEGSIATVEARLLQARLHMLRDKPEEAKAVYTHVGQIYQSIVHIRDHKFLHFMVDHATLLHRTGAPKDQILNLVDMVIQNTECYNQYISWMDEAFKLAILVSEESEQKAENDETSWNGRHKTWLSGHPRPESSSISWDLLHEEPNEKGFMSRWNVWGRKKLADIVRGIKINADQETTDKEAADNSEPHDNNLEGLQELTGMTKEFDEAESGVSSGTEDSDPDSDSTDEWEKSERIVNQKSEDNVQ